MRVSSNQKDYRLITIIGNGCFGASSISLAKYVPSGTLIALKITHMEDSNLAAVDFNLFQHEVIIQRQVHHPNILPLYHSFVSAHCVWSVMPLMEFGSCKDLLHAHFVEGLPELAITMVLQDVLEALQYLHSRSIIHRSVKASHILISASGQVCLSGMRHSISMVKNGGRSQNLHDFPEHYNQSLLWASPELLAQNMQGYNTATDIYSLGITACELANGIVPFSDVSCTEMLQQKLEGIRPLLFDVTTFPKHEHLTDGQPTTSCTEGQRRFSENFHKFVAMCLQMDTAGRPGASKLLNDAFFRCTKRRSANSPSLSSLIQPVKPLTEILQELTPEVSDSQSLQAIVDEMNRVSIKSNSQWDFS